MAVELSLSLNGWPESPGTDRAAELYGSDHGWHVERITRFTIDSDDATDIDEALSEFEAEPHGLGEAGRWATSFK